MLCDRTMVKKPTKNKPTLQQRKRKTTEKKRELKTRKEFTMKVLLRAELITIITRAVSCDGKSIQQAQICEQVANMFHNQIDA